MNLVNSKALAKALGFASLFSLVFVASNSSAVTYQDSVDVSFTFNPSISVDLSTSELVISELTPGTTADSNALTVSVSTNSAYGYYLTATAGTSSTSSNLVNTSNNNYVFSSIATNADLASLAVDNTWGYRTSTDNGTTWSNYSGLPRDNNDNGETGKALIETNAPTDSRTLKFKIGAKASTDQAAGTYTNVINFYAVVHAAPEPAPSMQTMAIADCPTAAPLEVTDARDGETYKVQQLADGNCWMLDNLRLDLTDFDVLNNTTASNTNASATSLDYLKNGGGTTSDQYPTAPLNNEAWTSSSQNFYSIPMIISTYKDQTTTSYGNGSGKIGVYYNYCAASAGSYCYGNGTSAGTSSGNATEDLCPAGWRMPTGGSSGEYRALYTAYSSNDTNFRNALSTPLSGLFYSGSVYSQGSYGTFWSSTRYSGNYMHYLYVDSGGVWPSGSDDRISGFSMRCLLDS